MADKAKNSRPFRIPLWRRVWRNFMRLPPLLVWGAALAVALLLYLKQERGIRVVAFASEISYTVAPEVTGRLKRLDVNLNQDVVRGQIVAILDDDELLLDLNEARMELNRLKLELGREEALWEINAAGQETDQQTNLRRFAMDSENAHIDFLKSTADLAEDRIRLQGLELVLDRSASLQETELVPVASLDEDRIAYQALREKISREEPLVKEMQNHYQEARARYSTFVSEHLAAIPDSEQILKPLEYAVKVQEVRIEKVNLAIVKRVLRSPADGKVIEILRRPGEIVAMGQPVVTIIEPKSGEVVAYLPEERILDVKAGQPVKVRRKADPSQEYLSTVASIGTGVQQLPARIDPAAVVPRWGLAVHIPLSESLEAKPGESFEIIFKRADNGWYKKVD